MQAETHPKIVVVALKDLQRSATNPRKKFDPARLEELAQSIRDRGVLSPLWIRPRWCVGWHGVGSVMPGQTSEQAAAPYEVLAGECRYRAALLAELTEVPCIVHEVCDEEALEIQLIENLQRTDLDPLEEAEGFAQMLELRDGEERPIWTVATLAARINRSRKHIDRRLKLLQLPLIAREALSDVLPVNTACLIGRIPDAAKREEAAKKILEGEPWLPGVMSFRRAAEWISQHCMVSTKKATWELTDATLEPSAGPCTTCPHLAANAEDIEVASGQDGQTGVRADMCLNPACFALKTELAFAKFAEGHGGEQRKLIPPDKAEPLLDATGKKFNLHSSRIVNLADRPVAGSAAGEASDKSWKQLIKGQEVTVHVARGADGKAVEGVAIADAVRAARANGHDVRNLFATANSAESKKDREQREAANQEKREIEQELLRALLLKVPETVKAEPLPLLVRVLRHDIQDTDLNLEILFQDDPDAMLEEILRSEVPHRICAFTAQWLILRWAEMAPLDGDAFIDLTKDCGLDVKAERKAILAARKKEVSAVKIIGPMPDEKFPAEITWDVKGRKFRVADPEGHLETSERTAYCLGWNDAVAEKDRSLGKLGWSPQLVAAYREGSRQAMLEGKPLPDMVAAQEFWEILEEVRELPLVDFPVTIEWLSKKYDCTDDQANRVLVAFCDEVRDRGAKEKPVKAKGNEKAAKECNHEGHEGTKPKSVADEVAAGLAIEDQSADETLVLKAKVASTVFAEALAKVTDRFLEDLLKRPDFNDEKRRIAIVAELSGRCVASEIEVRG